MTTSDLSPLVNHPVNLLVLEELMNQTTVHDLHLFVIDKDYAVTFCRESLGEGSILENAPAGTVVNDLEVVHAKGVYPIHYSIVTDGVVDQPFELMDVETNQPSLNITVHDEKHGVKVVSARPLDRETKDSYTVTLRAANTDFISTAQITGTIQILDENDNDPVFDQLVYDFDVYPQFVNLKCALENPQLTEIKWERFTTIGKVSASDADKDKVAYKLLTPTNLVIIVPQTGELMLAGDPEYVVDEEENFEVTLLVEAHDCQVPSRATRVPARVNIRFITSTNQPVPEVHRIQKRKTTVRRAVRPTKKIDFTETDGNVEGKIVFQLEKETDNETYKIRDDNRWIKVAPNGSVLVKEKWDYEELGPDKAIDFWVTISNKGEIFNLKLTNLKEVLTVLISLYSNLLSLFFFLHFHWILKI